MDVDYTGFASQMGNNNRQAIASLMQLIQSNKENRRLEQKDAEARKLQELQIAKLKEEQDYQTGLKQAMAQPQSTTELSQSPVQPLPSLASLGLNRPDYVPPPSASPRTPQEQSDIEGLQANVNKYPGLAKLAGADERLQQMQAASPTTTPQPSLASLGGLPEFAPQPPNVQAPMLPGVAQTTKTETPVAAGARYALEHGRTEDAAKYVSLNETMAKQAAMAKAYGSPEKAAEIDANLEKMTKASTLLTGWKKAGGVQFAMTQAAKMPDLFGKIDLTQLTSDGQINKYALPNGQFAVWSDDNPGSIHLTTAPSEAAANAHQVQEIPSADGRTAQKLQYNPQTKRYDIPVGGQYLVKSQVPNINVQMKGGNGTQGTDSQIAAWADKIAKGESALSEIPGRGPIRSQVVEYLAKNYPEVDLAQAGGRKKWVQSSGTMQTLALVDATKGIVNDMRTAYKKLDRTDVPAINAVQDVWQRATGNPDRSEYMSLKNYGVQEVEKMLSGSGAMSDHRIKLAFDNLKESNTPDQFERALNGIQRVMGERERATRQGPYSGPSKPQQSGKKLSPRAQSVADRY